MDFRTLGMEPPEAGTCSWGAGQKDSVAVITIFFLTPLHRLGLWGSLGLSWQDLSFILSLVSVHPDSEVHPPTENPG